VKQWRALATRYDKHALIYRSAVVLAGIMIWLRP
jgi:transposase